MYPIHFFQLVNFLIPLKTFEDIFRTKLLGILSAQKMTYFSHGPCQIVQLKGLHLEGINENVPGYGNSKMQARAVHKIVVHPNSLTI